MIRNILILFALIGLGVFYMHYTDRIIPTSHIADHIQARKQLKAPDFQFAALDGTKYFLSDFKGKAIVLNFWASWCAPCVIEFPLMLELADKTKDVSVFVFMSTDETKEDIKKFLSKQKNYKQHNVIIAHDADKSVSQKLFQTYKLPETYVIDADQMIADKIVGADIEWNSPAMVQKIKDLGK